MVQERTSSWRLTGRGGDIARPVRSWDNSSALSSDKEPMARQSISFAMIPGFQKVGRLMIKRFDQDAPKPSIVRSYRLDFLYF